MRALRIKKFTANDFLKLGEMPVQITIKNATPAILELRLLSTKNNTKNTVYNEWVIAAKAHRARLIVCFRNFGI